MTAVATVRARAARCGYRLRVCDGIAELFNDDERVVPSYSGTVDGCGAWLAELTQPADPAYLIVSAANQPGAVRDSLREYADRLSAAGAFDGLSRNDGRTVAAIIAWDVLHGDEAMGLRKRAGRVAAGSWGGWDHPAAVARAFTVAATELEQL